MRIALIADVHGNLPALEAVLEELEKESLDLLLHAGDIVGYYPFPNEVVELFKKHNILSILGNHDRTIITQLEDLSEYTSPAKESIFWTKDVLTNSSLDYLSRLPKSFKVNSESLLCVHGSPSDPDEYITKDRFSPKLLKKGDCRILVLAHTHFQHKAKFKEGLIINPGSVGQARDMKGKAAFTILDTLDMDVEMHRIKYELDVVVDEILERELSIELIKMLKKR